MLKKSLNNFLNHIQKKNLKTCNSRCISTKKYPQDKEEPSLFFQYNSRTDHNRVYVWGLANTGALGISQKFIEDSKHVVRNPRRLSFAEKHDVIDIACGFGFTLYAIETTENIKIYGTGINTDSQLGYHLSKSRKNLELLFYPSPIKLPDPFHDETKIIRISAGRAHALILTSEGLFTLGNNAYGQCGRTIIKDENYLGSSVINYIPNIDGKKIIDIHCGQDHSLAITEDNQVYACGWGADGQTGLAHYNNTSKFTRVIGDIQGENIVKLSCSADCVLALNDKNELFGWGNSEYGQLQAGGYEQQINVSQKLSFSSEIGKVVDVASGGSFCMALNDVGHLYVWGYGLLGKGVELYYPRPWMVPPVLLGCNEFQPENKVIKITCGISHLAAITNLGHLYMWGRNRECCLGLGHTEDQCIPLKVAVGASVLKISCGLDHNVAICQPFV